MENINIIDLLREYEDRKEIPSFTAYYSKIQPVELELFEQKTSIKLPDDYRSVLLTFGGGSVDGEEDNIILLSTKELLADNLIHIEDVKNALVIGTDNGGNYYFYDTANEFSKENYAIFNVYPGNASKEFCSFYASNLTELIYKIIHEIPFED